MEVKSHTHTQSKVIWAKQKQPVCTHKRIIGNGERLPLGGHKAPVSASCPQRQGNCCINTHIQGGCQYFSHHFICLHSFLSSLVSNYLFLWTDSCFHWHFTHTNFYENFLSLCLSSFSACKGLWTRQMFIHASWFAPRSPGCCVNVCCYNLLYSYRTVQQ